MHGIVVQYLVPSAAGKRELLQQPAVLPRRVVLY